MFVSLQDKSSGAPQLGLRQTPRPRTIFQAGLTPHTHGKPRRQSRKQEHSTSPVNSRECEAIKNVKHNVQAASVDAADSATSRGQQGGDNVTSCTDTHPSTSGGVEVELSACRITSFIKEFNKEAFYSFYFVFEYVVKAADSLTAPG